MIIADYSDDTPQPKRFGVTPWILPVILLLIVGAIVIKGAQDKPQSEIAWLTQLATDGDTGAQLQLGLAYMEGRYKLVSNPSLGLYWLTMAAKAGNPYAEDLVGEAYAAGEGTKTNPQIAFEWWQKALKDGDRNARWDLGEALIQAGKLKEAKRLLM